MLICICGLPAENRKCAPAAWRTEQRKRNAYLPNRWQICVLFFAVLEDGEHEQNCEVWPHSDKTGDSKGYPFGTQPLEQRCSVLYLLSRLAGKMRVSHDGHTRFSRQESGQIFANGNEQKACLVLEVAAGILRPRVLTQAQNTSQKTSSAFQSRPASLLSCHHRQSGKLEARFYQYLFL